MSDLEPISLESLKHQMKGLQETIIEIHKQMQPSLKAISHISAQMNREIESVIHVVSQMPGVKRWAKCLEVGIKNHPILDELFNGDFDADSLEDNWIEIQEYLWQRRVDELLGADGQDRYAQLLAAQNAKAYIAVCRATYAEIENLIRQELFKDKSFMDAYQKKDKAKDRAKYTASKVKEGIYSKPSMWGIDPSDSIDEIDTNTLSVLEQLSETFDSFDPEKARELDARKKLDLSRNRHFHAHGWSKRANYLDGLNALLLFDLAMNILAEVNSDLEGEE